MGAKVVEKAVVAVKAVGKEAVAILIGRVEPETHQGEIEETIRHQRNNARAHSIAINQQMVPGLEEPEINLLTILAGGITPFSPD